MHGANATGRPFTGDYAGILLYETLASAGLANQSTSKPGDGLVLMGCRITNAVKCLPPANKPTTAEVDRCNDYLTNEIGALSSSSVVLALGGIAHRAVLKALGLKLSAHPFAHGACFDLPEGRTLLSSYHCSRYNTQTKRLTPAMFRSVVEEAKRRAGLT